jgi:hypothetical protein
MTMGGSGSGRHGGANCTDDLRALDIRRLQREGALVPGHSFTRVWMRRGEVVASVRIEVNGAGVVLSYQRHRGGEWRTQRYPVSLSWTTCTYGGKRAWWLCPASGCGRRVAILHEGPIFACRHCHRLAYRSQRETSDDRALRRADKLRAQLGWVPGIAHPDGGKPEGMHWRTYDRIRTAYYVQTMKALAGWGSQLGQMRTRLGRR